jgi:hypothetical protein
LGVSVLGNFPAEIAHGVAQASEGPEAFSNAGGSQAEEGEILLLTEVSDAGVDALPGAV